MSEASLAPEEAVQPLTHEEIDRRIGDVAAHIVAAPVRDSQGTAEGQLRPHWISSAELVRRLKPFMVMN